MLDIVRTAEDLGAFADLGTDPPAISTDSGGATVRMVRDGNRTEIRILPNGSIIERADGHEKKHFSLRALLSSISFADLGKWADSQRMQLQPLAQSETIPVLGHLKPLDLKGGLSLVDKFTNRTSFGEKRNIITIVDGPAGIGKTSLIRALAYQRAIEFRKTQHPLVLHVESRGRVLQNITDLMAFSLQTLRLNVTYDQVPILVRYGLVQLAVDGFDELGDPNGYELAWAQINDLIGSVRGQGNVILSGRDTFLSHDRTRKALTAVDESEDHFQTFTLLPQTPSAAKDWLRSKGWSDLALESEAAAPLFQPDSYALRPFFLSAISREDTAEKITTGAVDDVLAFLINMMVERESEKFGRDIENVTSKEARCAFIRKLMEETARDLADNQSSSLPADSLSWLSEVVAHGLVPPGLIGILKNRAGVLAFLKDDDRRGYKAFIHDKVYDYFLSKSLIESVKNNDIPKYVRRNVISTDFLETFCSIFRSESQVDVDLFFEVLINSVNKVSYHDASRSNLTVIGLAACCVSIPSIVPIFSDVSIGEAYLTETISAISLTDVVISQLTARGADLRAAQFDGNSAIVSLVADDSFIPSQTMPKPGVVELNEKTIYNSSDIANWLRKQYFKGIELEGVSVADALKGIDFFDLLNRIARYRPFWIKEGDDGVGRRIIDDPNWPALKELMLKHDLLVERADLPASGRPGRFYHVRGRDKLNISRSDRSPASDFMKEFVLMALEHHFNQIGILEKK